MLKIYRTLPAFCSIMVMINIMMQAREAQDMAIEGHENRGYMAGLTFAFLAAITGLGGAAWELGTRATVEFTVAGKNPVRVVPNDCGNGEIYHVTTTQGEVFENKDTVLSRKFSKSCAIQNSLQEGHSYKANVYGLKRFNQMRNIIDIVEDITPPPPPLPLLPATLAPGP